MQALLVADRNCRYFGATKFTSVHRWLHVSAFA